jgi:hypothetical protein
MRVVSIIFNTKKLFKMEIFIFPSEAIKREWYVSVERWWKLKPIADR